MADIEDLDGMKSSLPHTNPEDPRFTPEILDKTIIAIPLLDDMRKEDEGKIPEQEIVEDLKRRGLSTDNPKKVYDIVIDLNLNYKGGRGPAKESVRKIINDLK